MSDEEGIKARIIFDPESIQIIVEGVASAIEERMGGGLKAVAAETEVQIPKVLIVGDRVIVPHLNGFAPIAEKIGHFAKIEQASKDVAIYRINKLSLWKAAELGLAPDEVIEILKAHSPSPPMRSMRNMISRTMSAYGALRIEGEDNYNVLVAVDEDTLTRLLAYKDVKALIYRVLSGSRARIVQGRRAEIKRTLLEKGYPVKDFGLMEEFKPLSIEWAAGVEAQLWEHQREAINRAYETRNGVIIMPPGSGKTRVAVGLTVVLKAPTLVVTNKAAVCNQFKEEYAKNTTIRGYDITVIHGETRDRYVKPITITTYQMLTSARQGRSSKLVRDIFKTKWGLIIFDEVQHIPADVWRVGAEDLQAIRKVGMTATPVREDKKEKEIFSIIGPPIIDIGWLEMEDEGVISGITAYEVLVTMPDHTRREYNRAQSEFHKIVIATANPRKTAIVKELLEKHENDHVLIIGYFVEQAVKLAEAISAPIVYGETRQNEREKLYQSFRDGVLKVLVMTSVGEEGIDLPNANVAISIGSLYGSRMGFSQKFGRVLRAQEGKTAIFYELVTEGTSEQDFSDRRRTYLLGQGYDFDLIDRTGVS